MKKRISAKLAETLQPKTRPYEVRDDLLKGFILRVQPSGSKTFICSYARGKRQVIGRNGAISAAQARAKAKVILARYQLEGSITKRNQTKNLTLRSFIESEYEPWAHANNKSAEGNIDRIRRHFFKKFGNKPMPDISTREIERWRTKRLKSGSKAATVNRDLGALKAAISKAVHWELIEVHPLARVKPLKVDNNPNPRYLSDDEEKAIRSALDIREYNYISRRKSAKKRNKKRRCILRQAAPQADYHDHLKPMVLLTINTGLRRGELFSLRWSDVDLLNRNLTVSGSYSKSGRTRQIPLNDEAHEVLWQWKLQNTTEGVLVFSRKAGDKLTNIKKSWGKLLDDAGVSNFRWHDLRHHFASKLVMAGVDLNTVRELLGHSTIAMTLRYAHLSPEHKADAVVRISYGGIDVSKVTRLVKQGN